MTQPTDADRQRARALVQHWRVYLALPDGFYQYGKERDDFLDAIAAGIAAARAEALEQAAGLADGDVTRASGLLAHAKKRYSKRKLLEAIGYQGDPDAECIHLEACEGTAKDIAAAIRALKEPTHG